MEEAYGKRTQEKIAELVDNIIVELNRVLCI